MPMNRLYEYEVEGEGSFPVDMLRYDQAWPRNEDAVAAISTRTTTHRKVWLKSTKPPTEGRWESFGWKLTDRRIQIYRV